MPDATARVSLAADDHSERLSFITTVALPHGDPLSGAEVFFRVDGPASLRPNSSMTEASLLSDANGEVFLSVYPVAGAEGERQIAVTAACDFYDSRVVIERAG